MKNHEHNALQPEPDKPPLKLGDFMSPQRLAMISGASGFSFAFDPKSEHVAYTNPQTKVIYGNPNVLAKWSKQSVEGVLIHESGHHTPEAVTFQNGILDRIEKMEIPDAYKGSPSTQERFK